MILRKKARSLSMRKEMSDNLLASKQRLIGLDLFRITAATIIFCFHSIIHFECSYGVLHSFLRMGAVMMTGFFMLSGFSLYYIYSGRNLMMLKSMKRFLKRRLIGILPAYFATGLLYTVTQGKESLLQNLVLLPVEVMGLQSVFSSLFSVSHIGGTWFVSCIILCYVCFPFILSLLKQMNERAKIIWGG